jgi:hypothetical protein
VQSHPATSLQHHLHETGAATEQCLCRAALTSIPLSGGAAGYVTAILLVTGAGGTTQACSVPCRRLLRPDQRQASMAAARWACRGCSGRRRPRRSRRPASTAPGKPPAGTAPCSWCPPRAGGHPCRAPLCNPGGCWTCGAHHDQGAQLGVPRSLGSLRHPPSTCSSLPPGPRHVHSARQPLPQELTVSMLGQPP